MHKVKVLSAATAIFFIFSASSAVFAADPTPEDQPIPEGQKLAEENNCMVCHKLDTKAMGPSYQMIAEKNQETTVEDLSKLIVAGGTSGKYKDDGITMAMPPQAALKDSAEKLEKISTWIKGLAEKE